MQIVIRQHKETSAETRQIKDPKGEASIMAQAPDVESTDPFVRIWELNLLKSQAIATRTIPDPQQFVESEAPENGIKPEDDFVEVW